MAGLSVGILAALASAVPPPVHAASAPDAGRAFEPPPPPAAPYAVKPPSVDPGRQVRIVRADDGISLYTETWLPARNGAAVPPERVPVVVVYTPYAAKGYTDYNDYIIEWLVPRGYAVTYAHVRGSGGSGGCIEQSAARETADGARIIEDAGEKAPWADGSVGMYGLSYPGGSQLMTATGSDRLRLRTLRALVVGGPPAGTYEFYHQDGVPEWHLEWAGAAFYFLILSRPMDSPQYALQRPECQYEQFANAVTMSGDYTPYFAARDVTRNLPRLKTPLLMWHGHADARVNSLAQTGLFDALRGRVPHKGVFGVHDHNAPHDHTFNESAYSQPQREWEREDWEEIVVGWYERWLRGVPNGAERWPTAQVQGTDGQWRTASRWPRVPGPRGALALGAGGKLGATQPAGSTAYTETPVVHLGDDGMTDPPGAIAVFTTTPLPGRLELLGEIDLDLWIELQAPDSHVTARLEALGADGRRTIRQATTLAARSARHLDPLVDGRFRQASGRPAPMGRPFRMALRFNPVDVVVPPGGRLRLTVTGTSISWDGADGLSQGFGAAFPGQTMSSGVVQRVRILHSCAHPSAVRFSMPERSSRLIDVREKDQTGELGREASIRRLPADGGGIATAGVCGSRPGTTAERRTPRLEKLVALPSGRRCLRRDRLHVRVRERQHARITSLRIRARGRTVTEHRVRRGRRSLVARNLPRGRFTLRVVLRLADGRIVVGTRRYRGCSRPRS